MKLKSIRFRGVFFVSVLMAVWLFALPPSATNAVSCSDAADCQDSIDSIQKKIDQAQEKKGQLQGQLQTISQSITSTALAIQKTQGLISDTADAIDRKKAEIDKLEADAARSRGILRELVLEAYYSEESLPLPAILAEEDMFQALNDPEKYLSVGERMNAVLERIHDLQTNITEEKQVLEDTKAEHEQLLEMKQVQKQTLDQQHTTTQSNINKQDATITDLRKDLSKLRANLSDFLGASYDTKDIEDASGFASKVTGVRKDFIMGMLVVESNLGRYTGGCDYQQSKMSSYRLAIFKNIADDIGKDYKKLKVSCPPKSYSGTGGAMGIAQFMSDTWGDPDGSPSGYRPSIARATGHSHPNPWSLVDGVTAMALKLAKVSGVTSHKESGERNAAKIYLSGTTSSKYDWYADRVLYWADNYARLLN